MSDSVVKLRIDSKEYDANIKRAGDALTDYFRKVKEGGGTLMHLDDGVLEAVKAMGELGTQAKSTKGGLRELTQATTDMTAAYRALTDEEKASPLGKAMQQSIQQMTERASEMKDAMADVNAAITNAASDTRTFDQISGAANVATSSFQVLQGATKVLGIEIGNDVEVIAKLQAAMAITNGLTQIQTALQKQSAFMQGVNAAKTALATIAQQAYAVATGEATAAQVAFNVAANANPYGLILGALGLLIGAVTAFAAVTRESNDEVADAKSEMDTLTASVDKATEAYERLANKIKSLGIGGQKEYHMLIQAKADQFQDVRNAWLNVGFEKKREEERNGKDTEKWKALDEEQKRLHDEMLKVQKEYNELRRINKERVKRLNQYARLDFSDITTESEAQSALSFLQEQKKYKDPTSRDYGNIKRAIDYVENILLPQFQDKTEAKAKSHATHIQKETSILKKSIGDYENQIKELRATEKDVTTTEEWEALQHKIGEMVIKVKELKGELKGVPASISDAINKTTDEQNKKIQDRMNDPETVSKGVAAIVKDIEKNREKGDKEEKKYFSDGLSKLAGGLSGIDSGFKSLGIDLGDGFEKVVGGLQGVSSILMGIQAIVSAIEVISSADALIPFARGGIVPHAANGYFVPGNNFSGDVTPIMANAGELILNKSSQNNLASFIQEAEGRGRSGNGLARVSGEQIWIALNAYTKRTGQGEIVTWKD
ncbi:hypothetical protein [uncultured Prevotella sp.]|uniref:hypothetical protein n=1 Tax=uncultured Prevotella sp. TaxID=159272 RepID=UPI00258B012A|nr:hypothetical protein [uncultured Prevotella sp.]